MTPLAPLSEARSTPRFNGVEGISLSKAGVWLDSRCFREVCERAGASPRGKGLKGKAAVREPESLSEGERFIMKRCKEMMIRRYGNLTNTFKSLDVNGSAALSKTEFLQATGALLRQREAE